MKYLFSLALFAIILVGGTNGAPKDEFGSARVDTRSTSVIDITGGGIGNAVKGVAGTVKGAVGHVAGTVKGAVGAVKGAAGGL